MDPLDESRTALVATGVTLSATEEVPTVKPNLPFWQQPAFVISVLLLPLVYIVTIMVLLPSNSYSSEVKIMVVTAVGVTLLGAITGFWLASSYGSSKKDETIAAAAAKQPTTSPPEGETK